MAISQILLGTWLGVMSCLWAPAEEAGAEDALLAEAHRETVNALTSGVPESEIERLRRRLPCAFKPSR